MFQDQVKQMYAYFDRELSHCENRRRALAGDQREDEAVFARVEGNVLDISRTVFKTALELSGEDRQQAERFFLNKLESITGSWRGSLNQAQTHGDAKKAHLEQVKLEAACRVKDAFTAIWRDDHE